MQIDAHVVTDRGRFKKNNEDAGGSFFGHRLLVVADGMGGGAAGEYASRQAVDQIREAVGQAKFYEDGVGLRTEGAGRSIGPKGLESAVLHANTFLHSMAKTQENLRGMGTTAVCCLLEDGHAIFANIGDSRGYIYRDGKLRQVTKDHSLFSDPKAEKTNVITRALGQKSYAEVDTFVEPLEDGDLIFLCTDGLDKVVPDEIVTQELGRADNSLREVTEKLVALANEGGGPDNITVLCARVTNVSRDRIAPPPQGGEVHAAPDSDDSLDRTVVTTIPRQPAVSSDSCSGSGTYQALAAPGGGAENTQEASPKAAKKLMPWIGLAAGVLVLLAGVVVWKTFFALPSRAPQVLELSLRRMNGEMAPSSEIIVERNGRVVWKAEVAPSGAEKWRVRSLVPEEGEWKTASLNSDLRVQLPEDTGIGDTIRLGVRKGEGSPVGVGNSVKLGSIWHGESGTYRLTIPTRNYEDVRREAWKKAMDEGMEAGRKKLKNGFAGVPAAVLEEEKKWFSRVEKAQKTLMKVAREMDELLENPGDFSTTEFRRLDEGLDAAALKLDRLAPPAVAKAADDPGVFLADSRRYRLLKSKLGELDEQSAKLLKIARNADGASPAELRGVIADFRDLLEELGLQPRPVEAQALSTLESALKSAENMPVPTPTRRPRRRSTPRASRPQQQDTRLADLRVRIEQLKPGLVGDPGRRLTSGQIAELNDLRSRLVAVFRDVMKGRMNSRSRTELRGTADAWAVLEFGVSRGISCCEAKPAGHSLEVLRNAMTEVGTKVRQYQMAAKKYGECP